MPESILGREANPGLLLHEWTKNFRGGQVHEPSPGAPPAGSWVERVFPASEGEEFAPRTAAASRSCLETFARRQSVRRYANAPLTRDELAGLLSLCYPAEGDAAQESAGGGLLRRGVAPVESCKLLPLAVNVEGLPAGAYLYDEGPRHLRPLRSENPLPVIEENFFQAEFTHAPVLILLAGSLAESLARYGDRGYRLLLMEAGVLIQRLYLAASSLGLAGCITGSLIQPRFNEWLGMDGFNGTALLTFAAGRHADSTPENV